MSIFRKAVFYLFLTVLLTGLLGCENEGPMERAGKKVDKAVEDTSKAIKDAGKKKDEKKDWPPNTIGHWHPALKEFRQLTYYYPAVSTENFDGNYWKNYRIRV